ncbi:MAG TPA: alpha/beta fold hydrolase [Propionibacteriaceae bacterium]
MRVRWRRLCAALVGPLLVAVGVTALIPASEAAPKAKADPKAVVIPQRYLEQQVDWVDCSFDDAIKATAPGAPTTRCASLYVPMDWTHPDAHPDIRLAVAWSRATGASRGLLTLNPGGPGVPGLDESASLAAVKPALFRSYDVVGFDPRGFGTSENYACRTTEDAESARLSVPDLRVRNPKTHAVEVAEAKFFAGACASDEVSQFVGTQQTVSDMEFLRRYLGRDKPAFDKYNFVGISYGTWLGAWYADTYPSHTGRFILDSNMNWTSSMYANQITDSFSFQRRRDQMFFPWVARHDKTYGYGTTTAEVKKNYEALRGRLSKAAVRDAAPDDPANFDDTIASELFVDAYFGEAMDYILYIESATPGSTIRGLDRAPKRKPASAMRVQALLPTDAVGQRRAPNDEVIVETSETPVRCNDSAYSRDVNALLKRADADRLKYPFIGYFNTVGMCSYWPYAPATRTIDLTGVPTILMVQAEGDPATAYEGAAAAHKATKSHTRLVSVDDEGEHGIYSYGVSPCVEKIGDAFLLEGKLPNKDTTCTTLPMPGDTKVHRLDGPLNGSSYGLDARSRGTATPSAALRERQRGKVDVAAQSLR